MKIQYLVAAMSLTAVGFAAHAEQVTQVPAAKVENLLNAPTVDAAQKNGKTTMISPRTGVRYTINNPENRPVTYKTEVLAPANASNVNRITATNPALSEESQKAAEQALLDMQKAQ